MFFIRDPFAPLVDPCKPSQARATKVHLRCKWLTQKKHFTARKNDFILETLLPLRKVTLTIKSESQKRSDGSFIPDFGKEFCGIETEVNGTILKAISALKILVNP